MDDFRRELKQQLLAQKVVALLDTAAADKIRAAQAQLQNGADFATAAKQFSDDAGTKEGGGEYPFLIDRSNRDIAPKMVDALFGLQPGQVSGIVDTGYTLEIIKTLSADNGKVRAAHISSNYKPVAEFVKPLREAERETRYISL